MDFKITLTKKQLLDALRELRVHDNALLTPELFLRIIQHIVKKERKK